MRKIRPVSIRRAACDGTMPLRDWRVSSRFSSEDEDPERWMLLSVSLFGMTEDVSAEERIRRKRGQSRGSSKIEQGSRVMFRRGDTE